MRSVKSFLAGADTQPHIEERWDDTLYRTMNSLYTLCVEKPYIADVMNHPEVGNGLESYMKRLRRLYVDQGMPEPLANQLVSMADSYAAGFMFRMRQRVLKKDDPHSNDLPSRVSGLLTGDALSAATDHRWELSVRASYGQRAFENGLFVIAEGIRIGAQPNACEWYTPQTIENPDDVR